MSDEVAEFGRLLAKRMSETVKVQTAYAICKSVDWQTKTMTASGQTDELDYFDIKLGFGSEYKKPKIGALCLIGLVENQAANAFLIEASELEEMTMITGSAEIQVKESGIHVKRGGQDLKSVLNDMIDEINKIKVIYGNTIDVAAMLEIKTRLNNILI